MANFTTPTQRQFAVTRDDLGTVRIVNGTTKHTIAALTRREAKQLSRELRSVLKSSNHNEFWSLRLQMRQQPIARNAWWISRRRS